MSASGEHKVKHGDVFEDKDGYFRVMLSTTGSVWFRVYISKEKGHSWLAETMTVAPGVLESESNYKFNIIDVISNAMKE